jgi:hypothetical protein
MKGREHYHRANTTPRGVAYICKACAAASVKTRRAAGNLWAPSPEKLRQYYLNSKASAEAARKKYRATQKGRMGARARTIERKYEISFADFLYLRERQDGRCAICQEKIITYIGTRKTRKSQLQIDHCHRTGAVRGLLCFLCNSGLGKFRDNPALLRAAADYLCACPPLAVPNDVLSNVAT